ncbi:MAG: cell division protein FtsZ [Candidatus Odinarchaeia archaeon]
MRSLIKTALSKAKMDDYSEQNSEIESVLKKVQAKIVALGVGGAGNNTITRLKMEGVEGAETIALNTDAQDLLHAAADHKLLLGKELTRGLGAGNNPEVGEAAAKESIEEIKEIVNADMVFITCGLGGGTGTGASPVIAEVAKQNNALTVAIVTYPFKVEGVKRDQNAKWGLRKLLKVADTVIVIPNDRLLELAPHLSMEDAFRLADEVLIRGVKGISELITKPGLVNLDFADVRTIMQNRGMAIIAMGESETKNGASEAVEMALNNPLININISNASAALINICGGPQLSLKEAEEAIAVVGKRIKKDAEIIWGTIIDENMNNLTTATVIVSGLDPTDTYFKQSFLGKKVINQSDDLALDRL